MFSHIYKKKHQPCYAAAGVLIMAATFVFFAASSLFADEIYFKSGYSTTAVVINESEDSVTFRTEMGMSTIEKEKVDFIDKASEEENQALRRKWREKEIRRKQARRAQQEERKRFREEQLAKGLIEFEGDWITPQRRDEILSLRGQAYQDRRDFETRQKAKGLVPFEHIWVSPETAKELGDMGRQIDGLLDEIAEQEKLVESLRAAMMNVTSLEEADGFSKRIEDLNTSIAGKNKELDKLFGRADEIEEASVKYVMPQKFVDVMPPPENEEEE